MKAFFYVRRVVLLCTIVFASFSNIFAQDIESKEAKAIVALHSIMEEAKAVGLAVAVVKDGKIVFTTSLGLKNIDTGEKLGGTDVFRIASISKSFTATSIMQLIERGKLKLDDDISDILGFRVRNPKYPKNPITIKTLLSHSSSLNDSSGYFNFDFLKDEKSASYRRSFNAYPPGKNYNYCNLGYNLLGAAIEKISGKRFDIYVKENIMNPLGLYGGYNIDSLDSKKFAAIHEYQPEKNRFNVQPDAYVSRSAEIAKYTLGYSTPIFSPTGGMKISARDLAKYMTMHMNYGQLDGVRIISKKSSKRMQKRVIQSNPNAFYGFALLHSDNLIPGEDMVGHTGSAYGLYSAMFFEPNKKFGIVMINNGCRANYKNGFTVIQGDVVRALYKIYISPNE